MERKRKLPARAAARVEHEAKPRDSTPRERSEPQGDLASKDFQFIGESGVLAKSFSRSRNHWIKESLFEKYWTKPHKRRGITNEDSRTPPKDSMTKAGTATITIESHTFEATMYIVRDTELKLQQPPPPPPPQQRPSMRPIIQYGPPGSSKPSQILDAGNASPAMSNPSTATPTPTQPQSLRAPSMNHPPPPPAPAAPATPSGVLARPPSNPSTASTAPHPPSGLLSAAEPNTISGSSANASKPTAPTSGSTPGKPAAHDPIIALLAQRASGDATLRDLMKRIAAGQGKKKELQHFQTIVNQLNAEYPKTGGQHGPSADRLLVDGKTVKYYADEICVILEIVLASNPNQSSADLRPPPFSNPVVVALLKRCLDEKRVMDMCRRIAMSKSTFTDATALKDVLDQLVRGSKSPTLQSALAPQHVKPNPPSQMPNDHANGNVSVPGPGNSANPQAVRSKGPLPAPKLDVSAVLFDFGTGDRYLFPKFSVLQNLPPPHGRQVLASFWIVRKGSTSDYGGDPRLDYHQPVTIRIWAHNEHCLEHLFKVVAPAEQVRRYMDDVMDNVKRAEYIFLAMRLPGVAQVESDEARTSRCTPLTEKDKEKEEDKGLDKGEKPNPEVPEKPTVPWSTKTPRRNTEPPRAITLREAEEETQAQYRRLIGSFSAKEPVAT